MKKYVLYHGNCPDGMGAALAASLSDEYGKAEFIPVNYNQKMPEIAPGSSVLIVDFSYPREDLLNLAKQCSKLVVLDHHFTAEQALAGLTIPNGFIAFDMLESGATMAFKYLFPDLKVPLFFEYLKDRDLWHFKLPMSREVSHAVRSFPMTLEAWHKMFEWPIEVLQQQGVACRRLTEQQVENMAKNHRWVWITPSELDEDGTIEEFADVHLYNHKPDNRECGWVMPCANASVFFSEVGEKLLEMYPDIKCAAYYFDRADGKRQWGLRSRLDFDCSVVAKAMGGGGHKQASGFQTFA